MRSVTSYLLTIYAASHHKKCPHLTPNNLLSQQKDNKEASLGQIYGL